MTELDGNGTWAHTNVFGGPELIATYSNENGGTSPSAGSVHFALNDWLGSKKVQAAFNGVQETTWETLPYGDSPAPTNATEHRFTGKERDTESGLDYFGARYYASSMGRWMSPDWSAKPEAVPYSSLDNPQSLNLYGYVGNTPCPMHTLMDIATPMELTVLCGITLRER